MSVISLLFDRKNPRTLDGAQLLLLGLAIMVEFFILRPPASLTARLLCPMRPKARWKRHIMQPITLALRRRQSIDFLNSADYQKSVKLLKISNLNSRKSKICQ